MKNKGYNLIELTVVMFLISITMYLSVGVYNNIVNRYQSYRMKVMIISLINKNNRNIRFELDNKRIILENEIIHLDKKFNYESKNISNNFNRTFNDDGNLNKGFTIIIKDKNNKILQKITYSTLSGLSMPILNTEN